MAPPCTADLPRGARVELIEPRGYERFGLAAGERGTVELTDSLGTVHVHWDNGPRIGITADSRDLIRLTATAGASQHDPTASSTPRPPAQPGAPLPRRAAQGDRT